MAESEEHNQVQSAVIDLQNQTPTPDTCARPGSLDQTSTLPLVPDNAQTQDAAVFT